MNEQIRLSLEQSLELQDGLIDSLMIPIPRFFLIIQNFRKGNLSRGQNKHRYKA